VVLVIPNTGSGPVNVFADPSLAKACAFLLPAIPRCPGTHTRVTLLHFARCIIDHDIHISYIENH
jgi:hypothetical protein